MNRNQVYPWSRAGLCCLAMLIWWSTVPRVEAAPVEAYTARRIWTGGDLIVSRGVLLVSDGKVIKVGRRADIQIPTDALIHDLGEAVIIPGLVIAETGLATGSRDGNETIAPAQLAIDGFDFFADFDNLLAGGVTTVQISPGSNRLVPGQGAVVKLMGNSIDQRTLARTESLRVLLSSSSRNPPTIFRPPVGAVSVDRPLDPTRPQLGRSLASAVSGLRAMFRAAEQHVPGATEDVAADLLLGTIADYRENEGTVRITASQGAEVRAAIALAKEFGLRILLVDPVDLNSFGSRLAALSPTVRGVILNTTIRPGRIGSPPVPDKQQPAAPLPWENARKLVDAGMKVGLRAASDSDLKEILFLAGLFQQGGLSQREVLRMLTQWPAEMLGVEDRVGTLEEGKDADFVILSGQPFHTRTQVLATYIGGRRRFDRTTSEKATLVRGAAVYDGTGRVIDGGSVLVHGKLIRGVGSDVSAPLDAEVRHFADGVIVPGFIDLHTGLGIGGPLSGTISLQTKLGEQLYSGDPAVAVARQGGVTTVLFGSTSSSPTPLVAFKLGETLRVLKDPAALRFKIEGNLTSIIPALKRSLTQAKAYVDSWTRYEEQYKAYQKQMKEYEAALAKYNAAKKAAEAKAAAEAAKKEKAEKEKKTTSKDGEKTDDTKKASTATGSEDEKAKDEKTEDKKAEEKKATPAASELKEPVKPKEPTKPKSSASLEPYRALFAGEIPALVEANQANELREAIKLLRDEFKLRVIFTGADDAMRVADLLAEKEVGVAVGPTLVRTVDRELVNLPQLLSNRQIPFAFRSQATTGVKSLPLAVTYSVRKGLAANDALTGLSFGAARLLSLEQQLGSIAVGKDADLVVLSGPPFELSSRVLAVMIDGQWVYEKEQDR
ncbi:MAG: hypothetical protein CMJ50_02110 [Planctomycetaceae bacterium]|nr:hypothetical protein [Planctomycetaceae bacterium]